MTADMGWGDFPGPRHDDEVMASHEGLPTTETQNATHGAPAPDEDRGVPDDCKYTGGM